MDITVLQRHLAELGHLLPSQHELLNRLLFQLAFNDFQSIGLVGAEGSGKSTLALVLAELFSEQANVALLNGPLTEPELEAQLLQQWFGQRANDSLSAQPVLATLMAPADTDSLPLLLIVDNFNDFSSSARHMLMQLDCRGFFMLSQPTTDMALNLSINVPTLQDAGIILGEKSLDALAIAERFAASAGNMHLLHTAMINTAEQKRFSAVSWVLPVAIILVLIAGALSWYLAITDNAFQADATAVIVIADSPEPDPEIIANLDLVPELIASPELTNSPEPDLKQPDTLELIDRPLQTSNTESFIVPEQTETSETVTVEQQMPAALVEGLYQEAQLLALAAGQKVIQLAVLSSAAAVARFQQAYPDTMVIIYQRSWQGKLQWVVLAEAHYPDNGSARQGRMALAEPVRAADPFIKSVAAVQQEIKALARLRAEQLMQE
jgi:septal ring-binding cell division protein DamX